MGTFVGRETELSQCASAIDAALGGAGQLVLIAGEVGIGKTSLANEIARRGSARGMATVWARCWEDAGAPAFWPFIQVLRALHREHAVAFEAALARAPQRVAAVARLVPEVRPNEPATPVTDEAGQRFALFDATAGLLRDVAREVPLLVVLDDLHAVDPSSLSMLKFVLRESKSARIVVVGTYRDGPLGASADVLDLLAQVAREGTLVRLPRFERPDVLRMLESTAGPAAVVIADLVFRTSEGVPLFVEELVRSLSAPGSQQLTGVPIPTGVRAAIRDRLARLDAETRTELELASVIGSTFTLAALASLSEATPEVMHDRVERAVAAGVVERRATGRYAFAHGLVRESLYREIQGGLRAKRHANVLDALVAETTESTAAERAYHALRAAPIIGADRAVACARTAAAEAIANDAFEDAVELLRRALAVLDLAAADKGLRPALEADLAKARARAKRPLAPEAPPEVVAAAPEKLSLTREGETWVIRLGETTTRLKESRGLEMLAQLVARPGVEMHALEVSGAQGASLPASDAGEALDREAIHAYRERLADVEDELREAESWNDEARAERCRAEMEFLRAELSRAVGLGGKQRRVGADAERARVNVQRRMRDAMRRVSEQSPTIGRYLERSIRTGYFCSFHPDDAD